MSRASQAHQTVGKPTGFDQAVRASFGQVEVNGEAGEFALTQDGPALRESRTVESHPVFPQQGAFRMNEVYLGQCGAIQPESAGHRNGVGLEPFPMAPPMHAGFCRECHPRVSGQTQVEGCSGERFKAFHGD